MILFFEGKAYKRTLLESIFGKDHARVISRGNLKDEKAVLDCVGYYYDPEHQHVFILPKVFYKNKKGFGFLELNDDSPLTDSPDFVQMMKDEGWTENLLTDLPIYLYQAIEKYRRREADTIAIEKDVAQIVMSSKKGKTETSLMDIILSLRDFYEENRNIFILTYKQNHSGFNKVNWAKTIRTQQPAITGKSVIYPFVVNHRKEINFDEELLVLFFSTLKYINCEYHFGFVVDQPYNLIPEKEFRHLLEKGKIKKRLETIRNNYYNEKFVRLWELLYLFASKRSKISKAKEQEEFLLVRDFNIVFEDMIDVLLGDSDAPRSLVKQQDGKIVDHLFKGTSLTTGNRQVYYVGDSKYYKDSTALDGPALFKQYTYARNIIQTQLNWFNNGRAHLKYRDELTEGYNITPNFFISGRVEKTYSFTSSELTLQPDEFDKNYQFKNRIFDRDTLFLRLYDINFLFVLYAYVNRSESVRTNFKAYAKLKFRDDFIKYIDNEHDFYLLKARDRDNVRAIVDARFRELNGKVFCPYEEGDDNWGLMMMGLERNAYRENAELLASLSNDFIIKEYHLGTEPYINYNGLLNGVEMTRTIALKDSLKDSDGNFRRESVIIGCYNSPDQKMWILEHSLYNVRFNEGRVGSVCKNTQQVFTASYLLLYDYSDKSADAECYLLTGRNMIMTASMMKNLGYPKATWLGDEEYLVYGVGNQVSGRINVRDILKFHPEVEDGRPLYLYFVEVDCFIHE
jgi:hypothetical protein